MNARTKSKYVDCPKCGVNYSTLVKHKCFKPDEQKGPPKFDNPEEGDDQQGKGDGQGKPEQGEGDQQQQGQGKGGQGDGDNEEGDGEGEGGQSEGEGEGEGEEGEGEGEGEGPAPQAPEPEAPPVAVVCSVLKFGALTAQSAKNGVVTVTLAEDGLYVYGNNGDQYASETIPWGEFEKRSTVDGQFYVKEIIDGIDAKLEEAEEDTDSPFA